MKHGFYKLIHKNIGDHISTDQEKLITQNLTSCAGKPSDLILQELRSGIKGLNESEVASRLIQHGRNIVVHDKPKPWYTQLY